MCLAGPLLLDHEEGAVRSDLDSSQFGNPGDRLSDNLDRRNVLALRPHHSLQTSLFGRRANVTAALDALPLEVLEDRGMGGDGIVGEATRCANEGLGVGDRLGGAVEVPGPEPDLHRIAYSE